MQLTDEQMFQLIVRDCHSAEKPMQLTDEQMFQLIVRDCEEEQRSSDDECSLSPKARAAERCGLSRSGAYYVEKGLRSVKETEKRNDFEAAYRKVVAEPGSTEYQRLWKDVKQRAKAADDEFFWYVVPAAFGPWSKIALDPEESVARRLLFGRMAQFVLYHYRKRSIPDDLPTRIEKGQAEERGRHVINAVVTLFEQNLAVPEELFVEGGLKAKTQGFRMLRIRLVGDGIGWKVAGLWEDHSKRSEILSEAYRTGQADDYMWLHERLGEKSDPAYPNNAFNLALHASDWRRAADFGVALLKAYPMLLKKSVGGLKPICEDLAVWPGVAAIMTHRLMDIPDNIRAELDNPDPAVLAMMNCIGAMTAGIRKSDSYLEILERR